MNRLADHRRIGRELKVFATEEQCGSGLPFWLPAGATMRRELENFIIDLERRNGYHHVNTPVMAKRDLYERSGTGSTSTRRCIHLWPLGASSWCCGRCFARTTS